MVPPRKPFGSTPSDAPPQKRKTGGVSIGKFASAKRTEYVPIKKELEKKAKRSVVNKYRRVVKGEKSTRESRPALYDEIFAGTVEEEVSFLPKETNTAPINASREERMNTSSGPFQNKANRALGYGKREHDDIEKGKAPKVLKADPFAKERNQYVEMRRQREEDRKAREEEIARAKQARKDSEVRRRDTTRKLQARTKKGQPVLSNQLDHILAKLEKGRK